MRAQLGTKIRIWKSASVFQSAAPFKLTKNARSLSKEPRRRKPEQRRMSGAGAVSIRAFEVSRWGGEGDVASYGF